MRWHSPCLHRGLAPGGQRPCRLGPPSRPQTPAWTCSRCQPPHRSWPRAPPAMQHRRHASQHRFDLAAHIRPALVSSAGRVMPRVLARPGRGVPAPRGPTQAMQVGSDHSSALQRHGHSTPSAAHPVTQGARHSMAQHSTLRLKHPPHNSDIMAHYKRAGLCAPASSCVALAARGCRARQKKTKKNIYRQT